MKITKEQFIPNLFILGAARCGTSALWSYLQNQPEICMSHPKEPFFFEYEFDRGIDFYRLKYFPHWKGEKIIGEARHRNLYFPFIAESIHKTNPLAKLVIIVRNPIERAYSHWWWFYSRRLTKLSFPEAIRKNYGRIVKGIECKTRTEYSRRFNPDYPYYMNADTYIDSGYYHQQIQIYRQYFSDEQIKVLFLEDFVQNPQSFFSKLNKFIGLRKESHDTTNLMKNESKDLRLLEVLNRFGRLTCLKYVISDFEKLKLIKFLGRFSFAVQYKMCKTTLKWLSQHFQEHNKQLEKYVRRDLSCWI